MQPTKVRHWRSYHTSCKEHDVKRMRLLSGTRGSIESKFLGALLNNGIRPKICFTCNKLYAPTQVTEILTTWLSMDGYADLDLEEFVAKIIKKDLTNL